MAADPTTNQEQAAGNIQPRVSTSLEKILLHSSTTLTNKALNWRKLWTPYSQKAYFQAKQSQESFAHAARDSAEVNDKKEVIQSVQAPAFATKFYEEMERRYFKTSHKKENQNPRQSIPSDNINMALLAKSSEHLRKLLVASDSEEEDECGFPEQREGDLVSYETESAKAGTDRKSEVNESNENVILAAYQNVVKTMRSTRINKLDVVREDTTYELRGGLDDVDDIDKQEIIQGSNLDLEPKAEDQISEQSDNNVLVVAESDKKDFPQPLATPTARLVEEKMSKYEGEVQELKDILFKTFEYVTHLKNDISATASKQGSSTTSALVQTSVRLPLEIKEERRNSFDSIGPPVIEKHSPRKHCTCAKRKSQLKRLKRKLQMQKARNKIQHRILEQLKNDVELLKNEAKSSRATAVFSPAEKPGSVACQPTTARIEFTTARTMAKEIPKEKVTAESEVKSEEVVYLEELNEKLTQQLEDNMGTMEELYNTHEAKTKELEAKDREIERKNQQITELKVKLETLSSTLQNLMNRFQKLDVNELSISKKNLPVRGSITMDHWHNQTISGTDICPLSITTLSPTMDQNAIRSQFNTGSSGRGKYSFFPLKPDAS